MLENAFYLTVNPVSALSGFFDSQHDSWNHNSEKKVS